MSSSEERRENGSAMLAIGWVLMLFAFLVFFFHPAEVRLGETRFAIIAGCLAVSGLILALIGMRVRRRNR